MQNVQLVLLVRTILQHVKQSWKKGDYVAADGGDKR
jgi:hypothetical protein